MIKKLIKNIYQHLKRIPVVGGWLNKMRNSSFYNDFILANLLAMRDYQTIKQILEKIFGAKSEINVYLKKIKKSEIFNLNFSYGYSCDYHVLFLYSLIRFMRPDVVVETGVASGRSSAAILQALEDNSKGKLYSIDLGQFYEGENPEKYITEEGNSELCGFIPKDKEVGWLVPQNLRHRWRLIIGNSKIELPKLVSSLEKIDIFYHDSEHSYENMTFEAKTVWPLVPKGGFVVFDDIKWNKAFFDFAASNSHESHFNYRSLGIIKK
jgi:predicted O-methyltransferase YrrM